MYPRTLYLSTMPWGSPAELEEAVAAGLAHSVVAKDYVSDVNYQRQGYKPMADVIRSAPPKKSKG